MINHYPHRQWPAKNSSFAAIRLNQIEKLNYILEKVNIYIRRHNTKYNTQQMVVEIDQLIGLLRQRKRWTLRRWRWSVWIFEGEKDFHSDSTNNDNNKTMYTVSLRYFFFSWSFIRTSQVYHHRSAPKSSTVVDDIVN